MLAVKQTTMGTGGGSVLQEGEKDAHRPSKERSRARNPQEKRKGKRASVPCSERGRFSMQLEGRLGGSRRFQ